MLLADGTEETVTGVDKMWAYELGACDSKISTIYDDNDAKWILVKKTIVYGRNNVADEIDLGGSQFITLDDPNSKSEITFCCRFKSTTAAISDDMNIIAGKPVRGKLETEGSWANALQIRYMDSKFTNQRSDNYIEILGQTLYAEVTFSALTIRDKLSWFLNSCSVEELDEEGDVTGQG